MSTQTVLMCDAPFCEEVFAAMTKTIAQARERAKRYGWVEARTNRQLTDYCPNHSNMRTRQ